MSRFNNRLPAIRSSPELSRTQDALRQVLTPALSPVLNSPMTGNDPPAWISPDFADANWVNLLAVGSTSPIATVQFHKDTLGYVHLKGIVKTLVGRAAAATVFTLPAGYGPKEIHFFAVSTIATVTSVEITPAGAVICPVIAINTFLSFSGVTFLAEGGGTGGTGPATSGHIGPSPH